MYVQNVLLRLDGFLVRLQSNMDASMILLKFQSSNFFQVSKMKEFEELIDEIGGQVIKHCFPKEKANFLPFLQDSQMTSQIYS
jgi:hypothetical protein